MHRMHSFLYVLLPIHQGVGTFTGDSVWGGKWGGGRRWKRKCRGHGNQMVGTQGGSNSAGS